MTELEISSKSDLWDNFKYFPTPKDPTGKSFIGEFRGDVVDWCKENIGAYTIRRSDQWDTFEIIEFEKVCDAVAFKLRWL